ncbi:hypothetical protein SCUCBS95973_002300 [Sporothrix curviconia]|uniref:Uncharacterized protein n=1 Tax=Sporothrix curviconia TaxID=1260050 RepID=A0ABP0B6H6_9PEZI
MFKLARLGRPGQWILHHEELYHPSIDTRPNVRATKQSVVIQHLPFYAGRWVKDNHKNIGFELSWSGTGPPPDFEDDFFWKAKVRDILKKLEQVKEGSVEPQFSPDEVQALEAMEADEDHAFARFRAEPPVADPTPEEEAAFSKIQHVIFFIKAAMDELWNSGLAGKWVLHYEDLFLPQYDTWSRERYDDDNDDGDPPVMVEVDSHSRLRFDSRASITLPDFKDPDWWKQKLAELEAKSAEVEAGTLTKHHFNEHQLRRIQLLDLALENKKVFTQEPFEIIGANGTVANAVPVKAANTAVDHLSTLRQHVQPVEQRDSPRGRRQEQSASNSGGNTQTETANKYRPSAASKAT